MDKEIEKALILMIEAHSGQFRKESKEPYFIHPFRVSERINEVLMNYKNKKSIIITALLHDAVEDTWITNEYIKNEFGKEVAKLVEELTKKKSEDKKKSAQEYKEKLIKASDEAKFIKILDIEDSLNDPFSSERWKPYLKESEELIKSLELKNTELKEPFDKIRKEILKKIKLFLLQL